MFIKTQGLMYIRIYEGIDSLCYALIHNILNENCRLLPEGSDNERLCGADALDGEEGMSPPAAGNTDGDSAPMSRAETKAARGTSRTTPSAAEGFYFQPIRVEF